MAKIKRFNLKLMTDLMATMSNDPKSKKRFSFGLDKNMEIIKAEIVAIGKLDQKLDDYHSARNELCEKYALRDSNNNPIIENNVYKGLDHNPFFIKEYKKLNEDHKTEIDEYNEIMTEEVDFDFYPIKFEYIPEQISLNDFRILKPLIKLPEDED